MNVYRQGILMLEIVILFFVGFMPESWNWFATSLVSFSCAMQVQAFRKVHKYAYASTMCIGNLRSGTAALSQYLRERKKEQLEQVLYYFGIIAVFAVGAGLGGVISRKIGLRAVWCCDIFLFVSFLLMGRASAKRR